MDKQAETVAVVCILCNRAYENSWLKHHEAAMKARNLQHEILAVVAVSGIAALVSSGIRRMLLKR